MGIVVCDGSVANSATVHKHVRDKGNIVRSCACFAAQDALPAALLSKIKTYMRYIEDPPMLHCSGRQNERQDVRSRKAKLHLRQGSG